jgi:hypothetical protein
MKKKTVKRKKMASRSDFKNEVYGRLVELIKGCDGERFAREMCNRLLDPHDGIMDLYLIRCGDHWHHEKTEAATVQAMDRIRERMSNGAYNAFDELVTEMSYFLPSPEKKPSKTAKSARAN